MRGVWVKQDEELHFHVKHLSIICFPDLFTSKISKTSVWNQFCFSCDIAIGWSV